MARNWYEIKPLPNNSTLQRHHQGQFSIHNCKQEFEAMYGTEHEMLQRTLKEIENIEEANNFFNYNKGENNG